MLDLMLQVLPYILATISAVTLGIALWSFAWPSVKGTVEISFVDDRTDEEDLHVWYSYSVGSRSYVGSLISPLGIQWASLASARDKHAWYFDGAVVDVYYCPSFPRWACLERGGMLPALFAGLIALIVWGIL